MQGAFMVDHNRNNDGKDRVMVQLKVESLEKDPPPSFGAKRSDGQAKTYLPETESGISRLRSTNAAPEPPARDDA